ncbi:hypothetical protein ACIRTB_21050 [Streptomyces sp. NPDC101158]|uniref:hypothetical protein n=1 Tax=Streptomyces sp. NPDC101158 TaxID=3366117 RepID=UPI0038059136
MTSVLKNNLSPELCSAEQRELCAACQAVCHRYGPGGCPLCKACQAKALALQAKQPTTAAPDPGAFVGAA